MPPAPRFWLYDSLDFGNPIMSHGPETGPQLLIVPPLFEELNRTRKLLSDIMRRLAEGGIGSHLPDLPGTGESEHPLELFEWTDWRHAVGNVADQCNATAIFSFRGGCLLDEVVREKPIFRFSPVDGKRLIRDLIRSRSITDAEFDSDAQKAVFETGPTNLGGYPVRPELARAVRDAAPATIDDITTIRLETEYGDADWKVSGPALWRRAEPSGAPELTDGLAAVILRQAS